MDQVLEVVVAAVVAAVVANIAGNTKHHRAQHHMRGIQQTCTVRDIETAQDQHGCAVVSFGICDNVLPSCAS